MDFLNFQALSFTDYHLDVRAWDTVWEGLDRAAGEHGLPVQLCMDLPFMALNSVKWSSVTNARAQGDGFPTDDGRFDIMHTSLLYGAVGLAPFLDVVWTTADQSAPDNPFGNATEPYVEALVAIAAHSGGPVGFGDGLGFTNATLLNSTCRSDGVLLQGSLPATPLDAWYGGYLPPGSRIASAPTFLPIAPPQGASSYPYPYPMSATHTLWASIIALNLPTPGISLATWDLSPPLPACTAGPGCSDSGVQSYIVTPLSPGFEAQKLRCFSGASVFDACGVAWGGGAGGAPLLHATTGAAAAGRDKAVEVLSAAPVFSNGGWALLGEMSKMVRVSPNRFSWVAPGCDVGGEPSLCGGVVGGAGERVEVTLVAPGGVVYVISIVLGEGGEGGFTCVGSNSAASCQAQ